MKDNYDFTKMKKAPHPLLGKGRELTDNIGGISDEEFKRKLQDLKPDERDIVNRLRKRRRLKTNMPV